MSTSEERGPELATEQLALILRALAIGSEPERGAHRRRPGSGSASGSRPAAGAGQPPLVEYLAILQARVEAPAREGGGARAGDGSAARYGARYGARPRDEARLREETRARDEAHTRTVHRRFADDLRRRLVATAEIDRAPRPDAVGDPPPPFPFTALLDGLPADVPYRALPPAARERWARAVATRHAAREAYFEAAPEPRDEDAWSHDRWLCDRIRTHRRASFDAAPDHRAAHARIVHELRALRRGELPDPAAP
ncbi:hypothetical protein [Embleya sp. AB8]|uniref:hypothetical protein n=1 Tax=Embleya sp. AB8 TaxID=3156304 RepID=UPI003C72C8F5